MMGYQISRGAPQAEGVYDTIQIKIAGVTGAALTVDGFSLLPTGNLNGVELVFEPAGWYFHYIHINELISWHAVYPDQW